MAIWGNMWRDWLTGLQTVKRNRVVAGVFIAAGAVALGEGILGVLLIPFLESLGGGVQEFGWLLTVRAIGGLIGGLLVSHIGNRVSPTTLFPLSLVAIGGLGLVMFNSPLLLVALVTLFLMGIPATGAQVSSQTLLQTGANPRYQGRVFGAYGATTAFLLLGGQGLAGALGAYLGTVPMLNTNACLYILAALLASAMLQGVAEGATGSGGGL